MILMSALTVLSFLRKSQVLYVLTVVERPSSIYFNALFWTVISNQYSSGNGQKKELKALKH